MDTQYIYLIYLIVALLFVVLALVAILRYPKTKIFIEAFKMRLQIKGETGPEQHQQVQQKEASSAKTKIGGEVSGSTVITSAHEGKAETDIGKDVKESDILTEA
jgi:hypothetical protein